MDSSNFDANRPEPKLTLFGNVSRGDYDRLLEQYSALLEQYGGLREHYSNLEAKEASVEQALSAAQERNGALEAADRARQERFAHALDDIGAIAQGLDFAVTELAALVLPPEQGEAKQYVELVLRRLFPRIIEDVDVSTADRLAPSIVTALQVAPQGRRTWESQTITDAGEQSLDSSGALVDDMIVLVRYVGEIFPDGDLPALVERVCHALAASLAGRQRARSRAGDRGPVTLLADETALRRLRALSESQGREVAQVSLTLGAQLRDEQIGIYGEPAWNGSVFDCAGQLDGLARDHGGEAFETEGALCCVVPLASAETVKRVAQEIVEALGLETDVRVS